MLLLFIGLLTLQPRQPPRLAPPPAVTCPRDQLTAYSGRVTRWSCMRDRSTLTIATDWDTTEVVTLRHRGTDDASRWFLVHGAPFTPDHWARIEEKKGTIKLGEWVLSGAGHSVHARASLQEGRQRAY